MHDHAVHHLGGSDLTSQTRSFSPFRGHRQHLFFCITDCASLAEPRIRNDHVAGAAGALSATITVDAGNSVIDSHLHQRGAGLELCNMCGVVVFNEGNLAHCLSPASNLYSDSDSAPTWRRGHFLT